MVSKMDKDLLDQLKNWNPMREAYNDSSFNKYMSGPGADMEDSHQPSELSKQSAQQKKSNDPFIIIKNVPENLTLNGLINICSGYGKVLRGNKNSNGMHFINFPSVNDMERVYTGLQNNSYGFRVFLSNKHNNNRDNQHQHNISTALPKTPSFPEGNIDYDRSYQISTRNPARPRFNKKPLVRKEDYDNPKNLLNTVDPQRHFLIEDDAHELDRVAYGKKNTVEDGKFNYHTGRAYYTMPQQDRNFIQAKRKTTSGNYDAKVEKFCLPSSVYEKVKCGPCESCETVCDVICSRCSAFFCNIECQKKEWQNHRYICGKPPGLVSNPVKKSLPICDVPEKQPHQDHPDSTQAAALKSQIPPSGSSVIITAISKTNVVFVRSNAYDDNLKFFEAVSVIQKSAKSQSPLQHTPKKGEIVFTKFKEDQYNRAMVLNADDLGSIRVVYLDYGNIDVKPLEALLYAPDLFWRLPRMACPITLKDVPDFYMTDEVKKYMYTYLHAVMKIQYEEMDVVKNRDDVVDVINRVELFDTTSNESYNKAISSFHATIPEVNSSTVVYKQNLEHLPLPVGEKVKLIIMDNSLLQTAFISCTTLEYALEIQKFQEDIQKYAASHESDKAYTPRVDELCIAKYTEDDQWYRGRCIEVVGDGHPSILFFDYGNISIVSVQNIRKYPEEFTYPIMTGDCEIDGLPKQISEELKTKLERLLPSETEILCEKVEKNEDYYLINLGDVVKEALSQA